jgi:transposase InsO family protein
MEDHKGLRNEEERQLVKLLIENMMPAERKPFQPYVHAQTLMRAMASNINSTTQFRIELMRMIDGLKKSYDDCCRMDVASYRTGTFAKMRGDSEAHDGDVSESTSKKPRTDSKSNGKSQQCEGCGRQNHLRTACKLKDHPEFNKEGNWAGSAAAKACKKAGMKALPYSTYISKKPWKGAPPLKKEGKVETKESYKKALLNSLQSKPTPVYDSTIDTYLSYDAHHLTTARPNNHCLHAKALIDTGSLQANYMSSDLAQRLTERDPRQSHERGGSKPYYHKCTTVCSGLGNCTKTLGGISAYITFCKELDTIHDAVLLDFQILDTPYDVIIGLPTIVQYDLTRKFSDKFCTELQEPFRKICPGTTQTVECNVTPDMRTPTPAPPSFPWAAEAGTGDRTVYKCTTTGANPTDELQLLLLTEHRKHIRELLEYEPDGDEFDESYIEPPWDTPITSAKAVDIVGIHGPPYLQEQIRQLIIEYDDVFCEAVRPEPARIPPMEIEVDSTLWERNCNRGPPRPLNHDKQLEVKRQVEKMLELKVIKPSTASEYSHVLLTPKPEGKWRFCIDYVRANNACAPRAWPIPNIGEMLNRIGAIKPRYFAKMDMTSGYHQAPLHENSHKISAFICFMGIFEWNRVAMGLKGAPAYFQQMMATVVLAGLMYIVCELYIDDVIIPATSEDDFLERTRKVLQRFREYNVTANPKKCSFGMQEVEYVGHVINEHGLSFSKEKLQKVLDFPEPKTMKEMKQFLGLVNYFRDHVRNHSTVVKPLHQMVKQYDKRKVLQWTPEGREAFTQIKELTGNCPTLYFLDPTAEVVLQTDASDYGIGSYLFQLRDGKELPTRFFSKSLSGPQLNWSVPEKEAYAIWYSIKEFSHLVRDIHFTVQTDHKNLTFINMSGSAKVKRWKLDLQEYDCTVSYITGEQNARADALSRLCTNHKESHALNTLIEEEKGKIPRDVYKLISGVHNSNVGHHGVDRTLAKLGKQNHQWLYMRQHVKQFIRQCPCCQMMSYVKIPIQTHLFTTASYDPMDVLNIDTIGPITSDESGTKYILTVICCFTRFVELYPISDTTATQAALALMQHIGRYGCPRLIRSDRGSQFVNETISELFQMIGTEHVLTMAYSKEENAIVERANKEIMRHLRAIVFHKKSSRAWSSHDLPMVQRILNAEERKSIGASPAQLLFGNAVNLDRGILLPHNEIVKGEKELSIHAARMLNRQAELIAIARETQSAKDEFHIRQSTLPVTEYPINSYVLQQHQVKPAGKLPMHWTGPKLIVDRVKDKYKVQDLITGKVSETHISNLKPFLYDKDSTDPYEIAMQDQQEFLIDHIVTHDGDPKNKTALLFKVRWSGYGEEDDTWEPWINLRDTLQLKEYLDSHNLGSLLRKRKA